MCKNVTIWKCSCHTTAWEFLLGKKCYLGACANSSNQGLFLIIDVAINNSCIINVPNSLRPIFLPEGCKLHYLHGNTKRLLSFPPNLFHQRGNLFTLKHPWKYHIPSRRWSWQFRLRLFANRIFWKATYLLIHFLFPIPSFNLISKV